MHKLKKIANPKQKSMMSRFVIDEADLAFCDLTHAGWKEYDAAYYAYGLTSDANPVISDFIARLRNSHPGIDKYLAYLREQDAEGERKVQRKEAAVETERAKFLQEQVTRTTGYDVKTKQGMLDYLVDLLSTSGLDPKVRADLAKQITDLQQYKKEDVKVEDNRINFYIPITCKYCDKCSSCQIKTWALEHGAAISCAKSNNGPTFYVNEDE